MINKHVATYKNNYIQSALKLIAIILTGIAFACVILFHTAPAFIYSMFSQPSLSTKDIMNKVKPNSALSGTAPIGSINESSLVQTGEGYKGTSDINDIGSTANTADTNVNAINNGTNEDGSTGSSSVRSGDDSNLGDKFAGTPAVISSDKGNNNSGADTSGLPNGSSDSGINSNNNSSTEGNAGPYKIKSACYGGAGRCYVGDR